MRACDSRKELYYVTASGRAAVVDSNQISMLISLLAYEPNATFFGDIPTEEL
jgi:hypothetical protein